MKIGIIGSGYIGSVLTRRLTALGRTVYLSNSRGPESLQEIATVRPLAIASGFIAPKIEHGSFLSASGESLCCGTITW